MCMWGVKLGASATEAGEHRIKIHARDNGEYGGKNQLDLWFLAQQMSSGIGCTVNSWDYFSLVTGPLVCVFLVTHRVTIYHHFIRLTYDVPLEDAAMAGLIPSGAALVQVGECWNVPWMQKTHLSECPAKINRPPSYTPPCLADTLW